MPYYHTIPTISLPQVLTPSTIDFDARNKKIYWTDIQINEVKRSNLIGGPAETIIDTGIEHPTGLAVDWISGNLFVTSSGASGNKISVSNLMGEYVSVVSVIDR
jgi:DNA-binding beta-propeller fold protein YncE